MLDVLRSASKNRFQPSPSGGPEDALGGFRYGRGDPPPTIVVSGGGLRVTGLFRFSRHGLVGCSLRGRLGAASRSEGWGRGSVAPFAFFSFRGGGRALRGTRCCSAIGRSSVISRCAAGRQLGRRRPEADQTTVRFASAGLAGGVSSGHAESAREPLAARGVGRQAGRFHSRAKCRGRPSEHATRGYRWTIDPRLRRIAAARPAVAGAALLMVRSGRSEGPTHFSQVGRFGWESLDALSGADRRRVTVIDGPLEIFGARRRRTHLPGGRSRVRRPEGSLVMPGVSTPRATWGRARADAPGRAGRGHSPRTPTQSWTRCST